MTFNAAQSSRPENRKRTSGLSSAFDCPECRRITVSEAATFLGRDPSYVRKLIREHRLPSFKIDHAVRLCSCDVVAYLAACRVEMRGVVGSPRPAPGRVGRTVGGDGVGRSITAPASACACHDAAVTR